jgi:DNA-binding MarR family transcriptional regulator
MGYAHARTRNKQLDDIAEALPQRIATLLRLFLTRSSIPVSRTEAGVVWALAVRPRRITELAARERVTQPAITLLVTRLAQRGWVERHSHPEDGRVVMVELTDEGRKVHERLRAEYRALLHEDMATLPDADVEALSRAIEVLDQLLERLTGQEP